MNDVKVEVDKIDPTMFNLSFDLKPNTIICSMCGCVITKDNKTKPCRHLKELAESCRDW